VETPTPLTIGFLGGTGPQGRGLGLRMAQAGHRVLLGSRDAQRAAAVVEELAEVVGGLAGDVLGVGNEQACADADVVFVVLPYDGQAELLEQVAGHCAGKVVVNCVNALAFDKRGAVPVAVEAGSAAEECAALLPGARVSSAFHDISAVRLQRLEEPVEADVLICGDDDEANQLVVHLAGQIDGMRGVLAGPLRLSATIEAFTAVLIGVNRRYKTHASVRVVGV
jgi:8-hydroxy-5-deazaflavin:NADPH oxidoreductase